MQDFYEKLYGYLYENCCPHEVELSGYNLEQGCILGINNPDLQICRNCWQQAIINYEEDNR